MGAQQETQAEKQLKPILLAESIHVLSSFELNQIASLSYGDLVCDEIFEMMEKMFSKPLEYTPLTLQKSLVVLKHLLIYGSEKCVNSGYGLMAFVDNLTKFNTVLLAHQQQGTMAFFQRIQGGGVDKGGPVREADGVAWGGPGSPSSESQQSAWTHGAHRLEWTRCRKDSGRISSLRFL